MRRGQRVQVTRFGGNAADLVAATNAVVIVVVRSRDQLRRAGAAAGELEERHFVGGRRVRDEVVRGTRNRRVQGMFTLIAAQQHDAYRTVFPHESVEEVIARKQRVVAIGDQHDGVDLRRVGVEFAALMAKERVHRRDADLQQREEGHVELGHVAKLHQRRLAALQSSRLKG